MSRKKTEINPVRAERIKIICRREGLTQTQLSDKLFMTQQNVSRMMNLKSPVTEETAQLIHDLYPKYRIQWILGYDDHMTQTDELRSLIHAQVDTAEALNQVIRLVADDICKREGLDRPFIKFVPDFSQLQLMLRDYAELIVSDYLKNREHSRIWKRIDSEYQK